MRVSRDPSDPGFIDPAQQRRCHISLDGVAQKHVIAADDREGVVVRHATAADGRLVVDGDELRVETVTGAVSITFS